MKSEIYIQRKLEKGILPYLICGENLNKSYNYYLYHSYNQGKEVVSIASGIGISTPIFSALSEGNIKVEGLGIAGMFGVCIVTLFRYLGGKESLAKTIIGQKKIRSQFKSIRFELIAALQDNKPEVVLEKLIEIQVKISEVVNVAIQDDIWPVIPYSPACREKAKVETAKILEDLSSDWSEVSQETEQFNELPDQRINAPQ